MTPEIVDSHCHLDFPDFNGELPDIIARARTAGTVLGAALLSVDHERSPRVGVAGSGRAWHARRGGDLSLGDGPSRVFACQAMNGATASAWSPRRSHATAHDLPTRSPAGKQAHPPRFPIMESSVPCSSAARRCTG